MTDFRLLALRADRPFAAPGDDVSLAALWHEPFGRPVEWAWTSCVHPSDTTATACLSSLAEEARAGRPPEITSGTGDGAFSWRVPEDALEVLPPATRPNAMAGILTAACPGQLELDPLDEASVEEGSVPFRCVDDGEELAPERFAVSFRRIFIRAGDMNTNPEVAEVTWDGEPWPEDEPRETVACERDGNQFDDCVGGEEHVVAARPAPASVESGVDEFGDEFAEQVIVQFYATSGTFEFEARTVETAEQGTAWVAGPDAAGGEAMLWFVVRDNRGGVSWTSRRVSVR